jgi:phospholipid transport system substrate-binding protein
MNRLARIAAMSLLALPLGALAQAPAPAVVSAATPDVLVRDTAQAILKELDAHRAEYAKDPAKVRQLVDTLLLPHFDVEYSARLVLGKHWRTATPDQRQRFIDAFYRSLLRTYGASIADFTADRVVFLPFKGDPAADQATVRTEVRRDNGTRVPVNYTLHRTPKGWLVWDLTIEGISYVRNFKEDLGAEVEQKGIDGVIARLDAGELKPAAAGKTPGT